ncbi:hypothetical protein NMU03_04695 [Allocoprobacillus halotolerans]|uniref:Uncharacterized protein n=1 Tax=Allocoprobacillus halotolerans TaxID=2944914 RepID=A0ABY5I5R3_9FIRM|nr:hypothetical protein [Allocoprobacillus halotolerans]UTY40102.1 hypothetical protein NMU03_04695 [Allocoprobacillus halotolerans]
MKEKETEVEITEDSDVFHVKVDGQTTDELHNDIPQDIQDLYDVNDLNIEVVVSDDIVQDSKEKIAERVSTDGQTISRIFDISILVACQDEQVGTINETSQKLKFMVDIPIEDLKYDVDTINREFVILREHENIVEEIPVEVVDGQAIFETNKFSTYALVYRDTPKKLLNNISKSNIKT